ncbi:MAG: hypothetical protein LBC76_08265 [Treponema sp.]|jgi:uncharacterized C2H2 Zn-finger protein|nr:hypothetical protein [Treponema sp.]
MQCSCCDYDFFNDDAGEDIIPDRCPQCGTFFSKEAEKQYYKNMERENEEYAERRQKWFDEGYREWQIPFHTV